MFTIGTGIDTFICALTFTVVHMADNGDAWIRVRRKTLDRFRLRKIHPRQSDDEVLNVLMDLTEKKPNIAERQGGTGG